MREIKFRAYSDRFGMHKVCCLVTEEGTWDFKPDDRSFIGVSMPYQSFFTIEQATGIKDKNGKYIYEGDIVQFNVAEQEYFAQIKYEPICACFMLTRKNSTPYTFYEMYQMNIDKFEIVGNIHEAPELLEEKQK